MRRLLFCCGYISQVLRFLSAARPTLKLRRQPRKPIAPTSGDLPKDAAEARAIPTISGRFGAEVGPPHARRRLKGCSWGLAIPPKWVRSSGEPIDSQSLRRKQNNCCLDNDEIFGLRDDAERNNESSRTRRRTAYSIDVPSTTRNCTYYRDARRT
jgi:hypothetical protein